MTAETTDDKAFEALLFASAARDAPPADAARRALAQFAANTAMVTASVSMPSTSSFGRAVRSATKWLTAGALLGSAVVGAYVAGRSHVAPPGRGSSQLAGRASGSASSPPLAVAVAGTAQNATTTASASASRPPLSASPGRPRARGGATASSARANTPANLAEEVERLDAARTALAIGDFDAVARELSRYEQDFPHGLLAREADLVAINALSEKGDSAGASRRARTFLERYPRDVHAARVRQLVSWQGLTADGK